MTLSIDKFFDPSSGSKNPAQLSSCHIQDSMPAAAFCGNASAARRDDAAPAQLRKTSRCS
jgi:hypothetical protein